MTDAGPGIVPHTARADLLAPLSSARRLRQVGDYAAAAGVLRRAVAAAEASPGSESAECGLLLNELGIVGKYAGDFAGAETAYRRALAIEEQSGRAAGANVAGLLHNLAGLAHARGDAEAALPLALRGVAVRASLPSGDPRGLAEDRAALAAILIDLGRHGEARAILDEILSGDLARYDAAVALHNLGSAQYRQGDAAEAAATLRRALTLKTAELGRRHPDLAVTRYNLGRCLYLQGRRRSARRQWRRAVALLDGAVAADHPTLVASRRRLATR